MCGGSPASPRQGSEQAAPRLLVAPHSPPSPGIDLPLATRPGRGHGVQALRWGDDGRGHSFIFPTPQGCRGAVAVPKNAVKAQAALQARRCLGTGVKDGLGRCVETNLQQAGAGDSRGKAACTPGPALRSRGGTAGKPGALPQLPAAAAAGGEKVVGDRRAAWWGVGVPRRRKIQLHREGLPDGRKTPAPLPASDAQPETGFENPRRACRPFSVLLGNGHLHTPRYGVCWPYPRSAALNTQLPHHSLQGHGPNLVFFQQNLPNQP